MEEEELLEKGAVLKQVQSLSHSTFFLGKLILSDSLHNMVPKKGGRLLKKVFLIGVAGTPLTYHSRQRKGCPNPTQLEFPQYLP